MSANTQNDIVEICNSVRDLLLEKNRKYGDSALEPVRVMSQSTPVEQILVRIDDKLSRISRGTGLVGDDEDVITDLIGYFVLLKIALRRQNDAEAPDLYDEIQKDVFLSEDAVYAAEITNPWLAHAYGAYGEDTITFHGAADAPDYIAGGTDTINFDRPEPEECGWDPTTGPTC